MDNSLHPIQLESVKVVELSVNIFDLNDTEYDTSSFPFRFSSGKSDFDDEDQSIIVGVIGEVGDPEGEKTSFHIKAHLLGKFTVDINNFDKEKIALWAKQNAPLTLVPFLREHIYGLASRAGLRDIIIPLFVVPTFKIDRNTTVSTSEVKTS